MGVNQFLDFCDIEIIPYLEQIKLLFREMGEFLQSLFRDLVLSVYIEGNATTYVRAVRMLTTYFQQSKIGSLIVSHLLK